MTNKHKICSVFSLKTVQRVAPPDTTLLRMVDLVGKSEINPLSDFSFNFSNVTLAAKDKRYAHLGLTLRSEMNDFVPDLLWQLIAFYI